MNLPEHGLHRYVNSENFQPLIAAFVELDGVLITHRVYEFITPGVWFDRQVEALRQALKDKIIVAHNAIFEQAVLARMGIYIPSSQFVDSAVIARAMGAAGKLEAAAPQLLGFDKMASGWELIKLFSIPKDGQVAFDRKIVDEHPAEWEEFARYCILDAELSLQLADDFLEKMGDKEQANSAVTMNMNNVGWHVDLDLVRNMQLRYLTNVENAVNQFRLATASIDLNLNSSVQLKAWCAVRGVRTTSFDEAHVEKMIHSIERKLTSPTFVPAKVAGYEEVLFLLRTKQIMGGSSLKKLQTIIDMTGADGRLHDQYLHVGAGATFRTTGRGVQMQNLKRLNGEGNDMSELWVEDVEWDNTKLASNLRQVFTATDPNGFLIVGDFSSVESRGLAWQAGEQWKTDAYFEGKDLYKVLAGKIYGKHYAHITKAERQVGKVGELACGYGAGGDAVKDFAAKMGVDMTEIESAKLVRDWRGANPMIVDYWRRLDDALHDAVEHDTTTSVESGHGVVVVKPVLAPESLRKQAGVTTSLEITMVQLGGLTFTRYIHGVHIKGRNICYWKPSERKTGDLWTDTWMNPKTKRQQPFTVYGGKLSGLLTQSLCREVFFDSLRDVHDRLSPFPGVNVQLVGQFHDEIVLDWTPGAVALESTKVMLNDCMSRTTLPGFPLAAEIKHDYRYTK
ncbi:MAG: DNA polymerase [Azonexus sp.]